jgi:hypothetical protein
VYPTNFPLASTMPAVPRLLNNDGIISGRNSLALFMMTVFERELLNSIPAKDKYLFLSDRETLQEPAKILRGNVNRCILLLIQFSCMLHANTITIIINIQ